MPDNFAGEPPRSQPVVQQPANRSVSAPTAVTGGGNTLVPNADGSLNVDSTPVLPAATTLTQVVINATANGDNTLVAGVAAKTIKVYQMAIGPASTAVNVIFKTGAVALSGTIAISTTEPMVLCFSNYPWLRTAATDALILNLSTTASIGGFCSIIQS